MASLSTGRCEEIDSASAVLVFDSPFDPPAQRACLSLCQSAHPETQSVLSVLFTESPEAFLRSWTRSVGRVPDRLKIISVDPGSTAASADSSDVLERVGTPSDLTALGVEITKVLSEWDGGENEITVCFDSLTPLLQYVDVDRAVRFFQELTNWFDDVDATAHVHIDPKAHDSQTIGTLAPLFDDVVELNDGPAGRTGD